MTANVAIGSYAKRSRLGLVHRRRETADVGAVIAEFGVTPPDPSMLMGHLSGGNQQKALLARASFSGSALYVLCEPTRGVDVATRTSIYGFIERIRNAGAGVLVITIDVDDALAVADRIGLVDAGSIVDVMAREATNAEEIIERVG